MVFTLDKVIERYCTIHAEVQCGGRVADAEVASCIERRGGVNVEGISYPASISFPSKSIKSCVKSVVKPR